MKFDVDNSTRLDWAYSSPSFQLLSGVIRSLLGCEPEHMLQFAWRELFNPLGMRNVTLEFDAAGTLGASTHISATARDWTRFGLFYLNDGMVGGRRLLPEGWVGWAATAALDSDYGAGFWTNRSSDPRAKARIELGIPAVAYYAFGTRSDFFGLKHESNSTKAIVPVSAS